MLLYTIKEPTYGFQFSGGGIASNYCKIGSLGEQYAYNCKEGDPEYFVQQPISPYNVIMNTLAVLLPTAV